MSSRRVVVTGLGLISPVGNTVESGWNAICNGKSGIGPITAFDVSGLATRIAGEIRDFDVTEYISGKEARRYDQFLHYGLAAGGSEAVFSVLSIRDNIAPPTINLENPSEGCDLNYVPNEAQEMPINVAVSNSFGFGGTNGTLVFNRFKD